MCPFSDFRSISLTLDLHSDPSGGKAGHLLTGSSHSPHVAASLGKILNSKVPLMHPLEHERYIKSACMSLCV